MQLENGHLREFGSCRLDVGKKVLWHDEKPVSLPLKAIELLSLLVERRGEVVTKEEIWQNVWQDSFVEETNLTHNIYLLRKTLKELGEPNLIETVPRRGYRFAGEVRELTPRIVVNEKAVVYSETESNAKDSASVGKKSESVTTRKPHSLPRYLLTAAIAVVLLIAVGGWAFYTYRSSQTKNPAIEINSIAILPLKSFASNTAVDEPLRMRITDALITRLGSSGKIAVRPTNAVLPFAGTGQDALEAGKKLQTDVILDGRIQQENERVRVTLQLIKVSDSKQLWAGNFDGRSDDILNLQDKISVALLQALNPNLPQKVELAALSTKNTEAYEAYLRGRYHWNLRTEEGFEQAVMFFEKAIALDPKFAEAYAGLGDVHLGFYDYGIKPAEQCIPKARSAISQALQLKQNSPEAYSTLGAIQFLHDRDWLEAEKSIRKSIELNPQYGTARLRYGWFLTMESRFDEARHELEIAFQQDPTSAIVQTNIGYLMSCEGKTADAERQFYQVINTHPQFSLPYWYLATIYFQRGDRAAMFEKYLKAFELDTGAELSASVREIWQTKGESAALSYWREKLENDARQNYMPSTNIALIAALQKDKTATLNWLKKAEQQRDPWLLQTKYDHEYDFLREDEQFQEILRKVTSAKHVSEIGSLSTR